MRESQGETRQGAMWMRLSLCAALSLALLATGCPGPTGSKDGGTDGGTDASVDAGPDGGVDAGTDGGTDAGLDAGTDGGSVELRIDEVLPVRGPAAGGTRVTLRGRGFVNGFAKVGDNVDSKTAILFGSNTAIDFTVIDDDTIQVVSPTGVPGAQDVTVQNPNGAYTCTGCFTYFTPVAATSVSPAEAPLSGGTPVTLSGDGFVAGSVVTVGGRQAISVSVTDTQTITFMAPPASAPGLVDVVVFNENGSATLRRGFDYYAVPRLEAVSPPVGPAAGGTVVDLTGEGLGGATEVDFGGVPAAALGSDGQGGLVVTTPAGTAGAAVDVTVVHPRGQTTLPGGFVYVDPSTRTVSLAAVVPPSGPVGGGNVAVLVGTGLDGASPQVRFGSANATAPTVVDANRLQVTVPAGAADGAVDVQVRNQTGGALLASGYTYETPITVSTIAPATGPEAGGTDVTITGSGFAAGDDVRIGALAATNVVVVDGSHITATTAAGSPGPADVVVGLGTGATRTKGALAGGFTYTAPLALSEVVPQRGAQSGGTLVTLTGTGLTAQTQVTFGGSSAAFVSVQGGNALTVRIPPGSPGLVDVVATDGTQTSTLTKAFQYYDPTNVRGGASGGPIAGTIDVTVLDVYAGTGIPGTHVMLGSDPSTPLQGDTDARGQITFSDPSLIKPQMVTASHDGYESVTVSRIDARDLTIYLTPNQGTPSSPPPFPPPAFIGGTGPAGSLGTVCGFKLPPDVTIGTNQTEEARVFVTSPSVTYLPPFRNAPSFQEVTKDCGTYSLPSRPGEVAVYAMYGVKTSTTDPQTGQVSDTFQPILMGITRGIEVPGINPPVCTANKSCPGGFTCGKQKFDPKNPNDFGYCLCNTNDACGSGKICNAAGGCQPPLQANIVLSMHMDLDVPIRIVNPPVAQSGSTVNVAYSYLELGGDGAVYIGQVQSDQSQFDFPSHPRLPGDGFVFLDMASDGGSYPLSLYYRRQIGDMSLGVDIGPMQPFSRMLSPAAGGALTGGRVQWAYDGSPIPDVVIVEVDEPGFVPKPLWQVILPGTETQVTVPPDVIATMKKASGLQISIITALSPRFDYNHFSYGQLGLSAWNSFTIDETSFVVP